jgi:PPOX class probable F420-dependent enzyme
MIHIMKLDDSVRKLLDAQVFAFVATLNKDGSPQVTPVWVDTDGEFALVNTAIGRVKLRNVENDPRVALAVLDPNNPYSFAAVRGRVVEQIEGKLAEDHIDKLAKKYLGLNEYPYRQPGEHRVILKIAAEHVIPPRSG